MPYDFSQRTLHERYHLLRRIGVGGMATVYEATDLKMDKQVAVKILNPELAQEDLHLGRLRQEALIAVKIRHAHLVDVTDQNITDDGLAYFVMEYLEGESLGELIHRIEGPMPWERVVEIVLQVCKALEVAHDYGVIHRDVKPANCLLLVREEKDFIKVLDLGIAKLLPRARNPSMPPSTHGTQGIPGTPEYMAPELLLGDPFDHRVDMYSLGIMMYRLLTGELPFYSAQSTLVTAGMQVSQPPAPLHTVAPGVDIPESMEQITMRALAKSPDERWGTMQEMSETLRRARDAELLARDRSNGHGTRTQHYFRPPQPATRARRYYVASTVLGGLATSGTLFMVLMLIDFGSRVEAAPMMAAIAVRDVVEFPGTPTPEPSRVDADDPQRPPTTLPPAVTEPEDKLAPILNGDMGGDTTEKKDPIATEEGPRLGPGSGEKTRPTSTSTSEVPGGIKTPGPPAAEVKGRVASSGGKVSRACKGYLDSYDDRRKVAVTLVFNGAPSPTIEAQQADRGTTLGNCVEAELKKLSFADVAPAFKGTVSVGVQIKR